jgi:4-carboxymuconolactone decarboxylase
MNQVLDQFLASLDTPSAGVELGEGLAPRTKEECSQSQRELFAFIESMDSSGANALATVAPLNILGTIAHHEQLLDVFVPMATQLGTGSRLPKRELELLALRTAWRTASAYEWVHHVDYGLEAGLTQEEIDTLLLEDASNHFCETDSLLIQAADELVTGTALMPQTLAGLQGHFSADLLVEILFVINQYNGLSKFANSLGVALEDGYTAGA